MDRLRGIIAAAKFKATNNKFKATNKTSFEDAGDKVITINPNQSQFNPN
eukprot:SAG31_NODE_1213_length_9359_cov_4.298164_6_plen_49_part_00